MGQRPLWIVGMVIGLAVLLFDSTVEWAVQRFWDWVFPEQQPSSGISMIHFSAVQVLGLAVIVVSALMLFRRRGEGGRSIWDDLRWQILPGIEVVGMNLEAAPWAEQSASVLGVNLQLKNHLRRPITSLDGHVLMTESGERFPLRIGGMNVPEIRPIEEVREVRKGAQFAVFTSFEPVRWSDLSRRHEEFEFALTINGRKKTYRFSHEAQKANLFGALRDFDGKSPVVFKKA